MKTLVVDNYDSFTYNIVHLVNELGHACEVFRNDRIPLSEVDGYSKIILSPGPGIPDEAGIMKELIRQYGSSKSILGVCLGHQGIAEVYGASLYNLPEVLHGVTSTVSVVHRTNLFEDIPDRFEAMHYHSWAVHPESLTDELRMTACNADGVVMAIEHVKYDVCGVQFHPESILTPVGRQLILNWLKH